MTDVVVDRALKGERRNHRYNIAMVAMVAVSCMILVVGGLILYVKVDAKASHSDGVVVQIRTTQVDNRQVTACQLKTFDAILKDARLAFAGDKNPADYSKAPTSC